MLDSYFRRFFVTNQELNMRINLKFGLTVLLVGVLALGQGSLLAKSNEQKGKESGKKIDQAEEAAKKKAAEAKKEAEKLAEKSKKLVEESKEKADKIAEETEEYHQKAKEKAYQVLEKA
jgi:hypothetical protein